MIIIPARLASSRFPEKMLAILHDKPLIVQTALNAMRVDDVVVAADDARILEVCSQYNIKAVLTDQTHTSGTDRCAQACRILGLSKDEIVLNIQGDETFLEKEVIVTLQKLVAGSDFMASLAKEITKEEAEDSNLVKVVLNHQNQAIYFSRASIPFDRDDGKLMPYLGHIGVYGFFNWSLQEFCALKKTALEEIEKLEQLRAIYHQKSIQMAIIKTNSIGIDTKQDLQKALHVSF